MRYLVEAVILVLLVAAVYAALDYLAELGYWWPKRVLGRYPVKRRECQHFNVIGRIGSEKVVCDSCGLRTTYSRIREDRRQKGEV